MRLNFLRSVLSPEEGASQVLEVLEVAWSPNGSKLAVCTEDNVLHLYDDSGVKRDKFSLKPRYLERGKKSFYVLGLAFSPDSQKIAVGQSDDVIFVYKIGVKWGEKKVICNKFIEVDCFITCMEWLREGPLIYGLSDGRVRTSNIKTNKPRTLIDVAAHAVSLAPNNRGTGFLSAHSDGTIIRTYIKLDLDSPEPGIVTRLRDPPLALAWASNFFLVAGVDATIMVYTSNGDLLKTFDYTDEERHETFCVARTCPGSQSVVFGGSHGIRCYTYKHRSLEWIEDDIPKVGGLYRVSCLTWKADGSQLTVGTVFGTCDTFETALRRMVFKNRIEVLFFGPNQAVIKPLNSGERGITFGSKRGRDIEDVIILGDDDQYIIARTADTLILGDRLQGKISEIPWYSIYKEERFICDFPSVCLIYKPREMTIVEYGVNEILMTIHTELVSPSVMSVRINERKFDQDEIKRFAYLLDPYTICIADLGVGVPMVEYKHMARIDWLILSPTGEKLLFQDRLKFVYLVDIETIECDCILSHCTFIQWVEESNAVVAQARNNLYVWYNMEEKDDVLCIRINGVVVDVVRENGQLLIVTEEADRRFYQALDQVRLNFETAMSERNLEWAYDILSLTDCQNSSMWETLAKTALKLHMFEFTKKCFGNLRNMPRLRFVDKIRSFAMQERSPQLDLELRVKVALCQEKLDEAVELYLTKYQLNKAVMINVRYLLWDEAYALALGRGSNFLERLRQLYLNYLLRNHRYLTIGRLKESQESFIKAFFYYMIANVAPRAAKVLMRRDELLQITPLTQMVLRRLTNDEVYHVAGELYEAIDMKKPAFLMYQLAHNFSKSIEIARELAPTEVTALEEKWGDYLVANQEPDAAINHYIEAGLIFKALEAAMHAMQYKKAAEIIKVGIDNIEDVIPAVYRTTKNLIATKEYAYAEELYIKAGMWEEVIEMYYTAGNWDRLQGMALRCQENDRIIQHFISQADKLADMDKPEEAERLYVIAGDPDLAISMYKKKGRYNEMMRLVEEHHPDLVPTTHYHLAQELESQGCYAKAKHHYLEAGETANVIKMYQRNGMWAEAHEVAVKHCSPQIANNVAYLWGKDLGDARAVKVLSKINAIESTIDRACDNYDFDLAFYLAENAMQSKVPEVHTKFAMALEDDGKFEEAEEHFIKANKPKEAVLMYVHNQDWENSVRVAEEYDPESLGEVLRSQAKTAFEKENYFLFERLLMRAENRELIVKTYQDADMWEEALRFGQEFLSREQWNLLLEQYREKSVKNIAGRGSAERSFGLAEECRKANRYIDAVAYYIQVEESNVDDKKFKQRALKSAAEIVLAHLDREDCTKVAKRLASKLIRYKELELAARIYLAAGMIHESINMYIDNGDLANAKKIADEVDPSLHPHLSEHLKQSGYMKVTEQEERITEFKSQLDMCIKQNDWDKCLKLAEQHRDEENDYDFLHEYVAKYGLHLMQTGSPLEALSLFMKYDLPPDQTTIDLIKRLVNEMMYAVGWLSDDTYSKWSRLRDLVQRFLAALKEPYSKAPKEGIMELEKILVVLHFFALREAYRYDGLEDMVLTVSCSLVEFPDVVPIDRACFEAGSDLRALQKIDDAFFYFNNFLDLHEAIRDKKLEIDDQNLEHAIITKNTPLPKKLFASEDVYEEVKGWILTESIDRNLMEGPGVKRPFYFPMRIDILQQEDERGMVVETTFPLCILSGTAIPHGQAKHIVRFSKSAMCANQKDWSRVIAYARTNSDARVHDVLVFIYEWCGLPID